MDFACLPVITSLTFPAALNCFKDKLDLNMESLICSLSWTFHQSEWKIASLQVKLWNRIVTRKSVWRKSYLHFRMLLGWVKVNNKENLLICCAVRWKYLVIAHTKIYLAWQQALDIHNIRVLNFNHRYFIILWSNCKSYTISSFLSVQSQYFPNDKASLNLVAEKF